MEIAKDLIASLRGRLGPQLPGSVETGLAWSDLHARLTAAHAAAGELGRNGSVRAGSFEQWNSAGANTSRSVNRTDLADGKRAQGMEAAFAGKTTAGGRGQ
ncbi:MULTISPECIES: hypothetical protein [unclassified Novosphingobium]|uniref:hypothetical protein n=1 Tax=unclassified Novosphingobium TaxID=2644732 RepID=UPI0025E29E52|nr:MULTISPECIES: hypothetical protein [unclassified Novosphingobium]HQV02486.1 hypothetical protein [Novosphingobium sp.]